MEVGARAPADYIVNAVYYRRHPSKDMHTHMYCNSGLLGYLGFIGLLTHSPNTVCKCIPPFSHDYEGKYSIDNAYELTFMHTAREKWNRYPTRGQKVLPKVRR